MAVWIACALLAGLALAIVAYPLLKSRKSAGPAANLVSEGAPMSVRRWFTRGRLLTVAGGVLVLAAAVGLYFGTSEKAAPLASAMAPGAPTAAPAGGLPDVDTMIQGLAKRLEAKPNDPEGWRMLGWSYFATQHYSDAVKAYAKAVALKPDDAGFQSAYGEALVKASDDKVTPAAEVRFRDALRIDPQDSRAVLYMALLQHQRGDSKGALVVLFRLLKATPSDAPIGPSLREMIRKVAAESGADISGQLPPEPVRPTAADVQAAQAMAPADQKAMIDGMVTKLEARLATTPQDVDGWIMLVRSRKQLGQDDLAHKALADGLTALRGDDAARGRLKSAASGLGVN